MTRTASRKTRASSPTPRGATTSSKKAPRRAANGAAEEDVRKRLDLDERRDQLLALGEKLFGERAYDEISIDDIAEAAGISKGLLYHYFGSKRGFYVAIVRESADKLVEATEVGSELPPAERARAGLKGYLEFAEEHSAAFLTLLRGGIGNDPEVTELVDATRERIVVIKPVEKAEHIVTRGAPRGHVVYKGGEARVVVRAPRRAVVQHQRVRRKELLQLVRRGEAVCVEQVGVLTMLSHGQRRARLEQLLPIGE